MAMMASSIVRFRREPIRIGAALLALALAALPAAAQAPEAPTDPDATLVEELVVTARYGGPAFWRVEDADTVVYVLGTPSVAPKRQQWDQQLFMRRLRGANVVILPARGLRVRLAGSPAAAISYLRLKSSSPFEERLPAATKARFVAARESLGQPAKHYGTNHPLAAALILINDYRERRQLTDQDPNKLIRLLAQQNRVPVQARTYDLGPLLTQVAKVSRGSAGVCLEEVLAEVEAGPGRTLAASRAWADGNVLGALASERTYERCLSVAPGAAAFDARVKADLAAQIQAALQKPGHAIAVVQLRPLLSQGGVLDRLQKAGVTVKPPGAE
jgi:TraB/PrgY/gumN family